MRWKTRMNKFSTHRRANLNSSWLSSVPLVKLWESDLKLITIVVLHPSQYVVGSKSFRTDIQKPRQMENAVRDI